ncbi:MAG: hotdog domain-containing protein [Sporomusaceae bacterium]|nr:hotdog domain-containing protein [Sporomusaceae bacterium]
MREFVSHHLIKGQDLNHHGTLYAGRGAEWFVEAGFAAAASMTNPENVVCLKIHGMTFKRPVRKGEIIRYISKVVHATRTKLVSYVKVEHANDDEVIVDGFMTFVHVDLEGKSLPHGLVIEPSDDEEAELQERAKQL